VVKNKVGAAVPRKLNSRSCTATGISKEGRAHRARWFCNNLVEKIRPPGTATRAERIGQGKDNARYVSCSSMPRLPKDIEGQEFAPN